MLVLVAIVISPVLRSLLVLVVIVISSVLCSLLVLVAILISPVLCFVCVSCHSDFTCFVLFVQGTFVYIQTRATSTLSYTVIWYGLSL